MKKLWMIFIAIFVFSFAVLAPPIPREVVTTDGQVLIPAEDISNGATGSIAPAPGNRT